MLPSRRVRAAADARRRRWRRNPLPSTVLELSQPVDEDGLETPTRCRWVPAPPEVAPGHRHVYHLRRRHNPICRSRRRTTRGQRGAVADGGEAGVSGADTLEDGARMLKRALARCQSAARLVEEDGRARISRDHQAAMRNLHRFLLFPCSLRRRGSRAAAPCPWSGSRLREDGDRLSRQPGRFRASASACS